MGLVAMKEKLASKASALSDSSKSESIPAEEIQHRGARAWLCRACGRDDSLPRKRVPIINTRLGFTEGKGIASAKTTPPLSA